MLYELARRADTALMPAAKVLARTGVSPNALTVLALVVSLPVALVLAQGPAWFPLGALLIVAALVLDGFDGLVARATQQVTLVGDFLDATLDRYGEGAFFLGLLYWYISTDPPHLMEALLTALTLFGSLLVSYTRARAEVLGVEMTDGLFPRLVRLSVLVLGLVFSPVVPQSMLAALLILVVGANLTAIQRVLATCQQLASRDAAARQREGAHG